MQLIGQETNMNLINNWKQLPNFIIIQGDSNTGKNYFVLNLCEKFKVRYINVPTSVNSIRQLVNIMTPNSNTLYHLDNFNEASIQAKNALLKITEEPLEGNYIVITGGPQIKTLESRARKIIMSPYSLQEVTGYMERYFSNKQYRENLYIAGINTPAKVEMFKDYELLNDTYDLAYSTFKKLTYISPEDVIEIITKFEDRVYKDKQNNKQPVDRCMLFLKMLISIIQNDLHRTSYFSYYNSLKIIVQTKQQLEKETTLRRRMLLFKMFYEIIQLRSDIK